MVMEVVGMECIMGVVGVEFMVVHVSINVHIFTKFALLTKTGSSQLYLLWSDIGLVGLRSSGSRNDMLG